MVNVQELERLAWPMMSFTVTVFSGALIIVALATPSWVQVSYVRSMRQLLPAFKHNFRMVTARRIS